MKTPLAGLLLTMGLMVSTAVAQTSQPTTISQEDLEKWLDQLGTASFAEREEAVRNLYAAGPAALEVLKNHINADDYEAALRARRLIERIQKLYLVGARVELAVSRQKFRWDEPVALRVRIVNPSDFSILLPFLIEQRELIDRDPLSVQVGLMMDALDFLQVIRPDGEAAEVVVDHFLGHPGLEATLDTRAFGEPASLLKPHTEFTLDLQEFNRGFARVRMLQGGKYRVQFVYVPEWEDPSLVNNDVGKVVSNELVLEVTSPAPQLLQEAPRDLAVNLRQDQQRIVVTLVNTHDRPLGVNLNLGGRELTKHAHLEWRWHATTDRITAVQPFPEADPVSVVRFKKLAPAESVQVFSITLAELRKVPGLEQLGLEPEPVQLSVRYSNVLDRHLMSRQVDPMKGPTPELQTLLDRIPQPTFTGSVASPTLAIQP